MKYILSNNIDHEVRAETIDLLSAAHDVHVAYENLTVTERECAELTDIVSNIATTAATIEKYGAKGLEILAMDGSLESFIGSDNVKSVPLALAALENGFTDTMKTVWAKIKEFCARLYDWVRKIFFSLEAELKHLEGMVDAKNDSKFNPNYEFDIPVPTKEAILIALKGANTAVEFVNKHSGTIEAMMTDISKLPYEKLTAKVNDPELNSALDAFNDKYKLYAKAIKKDAEATFSDMVNKYFNPLSEKMESAIDENKGLPDGLGILKAINQNLVRSGKASDIGYKTGNDLREVVMEFTKLIRASSKLEPLAKKYLDLLDGVVTKFGNSPAFDGLGDLVKLVRIYIGILQKFIANNSKIDRWILLMITRVVRKMYA